MAIVLVAALPLGDAFGRGFGGFGGGGFRSGGFGGFGGGGWGGGFRDGGFGGAGGGGFRDGGFDRGFGGFREGDSGGMRGQVYHPEATRGFSDDTGRTRDRYDAGRVGDGDRVSRGQLDKFLGMPTDAGLSHVAATRPGGGFEGTRVTAGRVEGPFGGSAAVVSGTHVHYLPPNVQSARAWDVRQNFSRYNLFTPAWYRNHPDAWAAAGLAASAWAPASWFNLADWVGCDATPEDYDYGSTVLYQGDNVYMEGQPQGSTAEYYDQATSLAASGATPQDESQWMSLGVFGMVQGSQTDPTMIFQLAINHQGVIRGNFFNTMTETTVPVHGAVDKKTQRAAWTIGDNKNTVFDTGLYNLTKDQAPTLVHFGKDRTQEWLMVRLTGKADAQNGS